jgi:FemAB family protein
MIKKEEGCKLVEEAFIESGLTVKFKEKYNNDWVTVTNEAKYVPVDYVSYQSSYQYEYFRAINENLIDISVVIYYDHRACGIWPLLLDVNSSEPIKSKNNLYGGIVIPPLFVSTLQEKIKRKIMKSCINTLNIILKKCCGECWRTNEVYDTNNGLGQWHQIALINSAELDKVNCEMYVDLKLSTKEYRKFVRKSYRPLISSGSKNWETFVMDSCNIDTSIWNKFKILHKNVSGRSTRSDETWNMQYNAIKHGDSFIVYIADSSEKMVGGALFDISKDECNYSVGVYDRELFDQPLGHMIQYRAIEEMKIKDISWYRLGTRLYKEESGFIDKKRVNISSFMQGFSTHMFPRIGLIIKNKQSTTSTF